MADNDYVIIGDFKYPSHHPPGAHWATDAAWEILDSVKPGMIPDHIRAWLAGLIAGRLVRERNKGLNDDR